MLHLGDRVIDIGDRDDTHANETVGRDGAILLGEPVVVAADHRLVDLVMGDIAPEDGAGDHRREQHLGVHAVLVLLADALLRRAGAGGVGDLEAKGLPGPLGAAGAQVEEIGFQQRLTLDHQRVTAIRQMHGVRRAVAVFLRHPVHPALRRHLEMPVARHQIILPRHSNLRPESERGRPARMRAGGPRSQSSPRYLVLHQSAGRGAVFETVAAAGAFHLLHLVEVPRFQ